MTNATLADLDLLPNDWLSAVKAAAVSIVGVTAFIVAAIIVVRVGWWNY